MLVVADNYPGRVPLGSGNLAHDLVNAFRVCIDHAQQSACRPVRHTPALFPPSESTKRHAKAVSELRLRHACFAAEALHITLTGNVNPCTGALALGEVQSFACAFENAVCRLGHFAYSSMIAFAMALRSLRSACDRFVFCPLPSDPPQQLVPVSLGRFRDKVEHRAHRRCVCQVRMR